MLTSEFPIQDDKTKELRPVCEEDIVILMRSPSTRLLDYRPPPRARGARRAAGGEAGGGPAGGRLGRNPRAEQDQSREKRKKSFHGIRSFWVIKIGKIP